MLRFARGQVTTLLTVAVIAGVVGAAPAVAELGRRDDAAPGAVASATWIKQGVKDYADVPNQGGRIAALPLPAGSYAVVAKLNLHNTGSQAREVSCELKFAGADLAYVTVGSTEDSGDTQVVLTRAGTLSRDGRAEVHCADGIGGHVAALYIYITATRASTLIDVAMR